MRVEDIIDAKQNAGEEGEIELANFIIRKLKDPNYAPSEQLLRAIRAINDRAANDSPLRGMIRTG